METDLDVLALRNVQSLHHRHERRRGRRPFPRPDAASFNAPEGDVYPGGHGMVVREEDGQRILQSMTWGFPLAMKSKVTGQPIKPKPVNNIADLTSFMWRFVAPRPEHRCIIPLTGFCEAEGEKGAKTRTWFGVKDQPIFAWAGMWKDSAEWGPVYSGADDRLQRGGAAGPRPHAGPPPRGGL